MKRNICPISVKLSNQITNYQYVELMKSFENSPLNRHEMVAFTFEYYNKIYEQRNHYSINKLLKICNQHGVRSNKILPIWADIINGNNITNKISHGLVIRSCSNLLTKRNLSQIEIKQSIEILEHLLSNNEGNNQLTNDIYIHCVLINAYGLYSKVNEALRIFNSLPENKINLFVSPQTPLE